MISALARRLVAASLLGTTAAIAAPASAASEKVDNSYICVFRPGAVERGNVQAEANRAAQAAGGALRHVYTTAIRGFAANISAQGVSAMMSRNPSIAYCEQDQVVRIAQQRANAKPGGGGSSGQQVPWGVARVGGGIAATGRAWVIDSGISTHPDLNINTALSRNFSTGSISSWADGNGHGTHVAGTIGARNNTIGVVGVAAGVELVAVRVLNNAGSGTISGVIAGVDYVAGAANGTGVANMSLGGGASPTLDQAVINAAATGVKFVLAAGNESDNVANHSPARANGANVYTVSAFGQGSGSSDVWASFSNYGAGIDYAEPGVRIYSTYKGGGYATLSGTSMAAPHLAGLLLLGNVREDGVVAGDPDGIYEPIGAH